MSLEYKAPKLRPSIAMDQLKNRKLGSVKRERRSERPHRARLKMPGSQDGGAWSVERGACWCCFWIAGASSELRPQL